jgi:hypothetical protein
MDLKQQIEREKKRVNGLIQKFMDSNRLENVNPESEYLIKNWKDFKGEPIGGKLIVYDYDTPHFQDDNYFLTSVIDSFKIVEVIPIIDKMGKLKSYEYYGYWSPFWFLESGWQVNHAACFSLIIEVQGGLEFFGTGDHRGQYDLILSTIEVEINERDAKMVKEWNNFKKANPKRLNLARKQVREEFVDSIIRKGWLNES